MEEAETDGAALHCAYLDALNSNEAERVTALLADDVVFQVAGEPEMVGREAVREWAVSFFEAFDAFYSKRQLAFEVSGDFAFDRYTYSARLVGRDDGALLVENGKGVGIFRRSADGRWLLIIDSWSPFASAAPVYSSQIEG